MYILRDYHEQVERFLCSRSRKAFATAWVLVVLALAAVAAVTFWMGAPPFNGFAWDMPIFIEGGWRIFNGQTPHKDFYSFLGDLPFYVTYLGMKLGHLGVASLAYGNIFVMVATGLAAMAVLRRRTSAFYACLFCLFLTLLAVTPRSLGSAHDDICYAMVYNRYGEAFLALLGALLFLTPEPALKKSWADWVEAGFAGFCLPLLLFCKINYFVVGIGFFAVACLRRRFPVKQALFGLLSAAVFLILALILTKIPFSAMWNDYRTVLAAQSGGHRLNLLVLQMVKGILFFPILLLLPWEISRKRDGQHSAWPHFLLVTFIYGSEMLLVASNTQKHELPLLALAALYGAETIRRQTRLMTEEGFFIAVRNLAAALVLLFFVLPTLVTDFKAIRYSIRVTMEDVSLRPESFRSTPLKDLRFDSDGSQRREARAYMETVDEGMQLLRRHIGPRTRLAVFLYSNPYHLALGLPPDEGGLVCWSNFDMTRRSHPPLEKILGGADYVLADRDCEKIKAVYGSEWDALHLEVVEETPNMTLFKVPETKEPSHAPNSPTHP